MYITKHSGWTWALQKSLLEAAALASWGGVVAATQLGDAKLPDNVAASLAMSIHAAVAAGAPARQALYLLVGTAAALAREGSGHHATALVATGGIEALQAALDCLPRGKWGAFDLLVGTHAASALGMVAQHLGDRSQPRWRDPEAQLKGAHRPALNLKNVLLTLLNTLGPRKRCQHQEMEEVAASAVMLLATHYDHPTDASSSAEKSAVVAEVKGLVAAVAYVAEGDDSCNEKSQEKRARVLQYLLAACWGMLRQPVPRHVFLENDGLRALLGAGVVLREGMLAATLATDAAVIAGMHHIAALWLCLSPLKDAWAAAAAAAGAGQERTLLDKHALWTTDDADGVLPELGPQVCAAPAFSRVSPCHPLFRETSRKSSKLSSISVTPLYHRV